MLTKTQRLEVENKVLRESIDRIKKKLEERDQMPLRERFDESVMSSCLAYIGSAVNYDRCLKNELEFTEYLQRKIPGSNQEPGKSKNSSTSPL